MSRDSAPGDAATRASNTEADDEVYEVICKPSERVMTDQRTATYCVTNHNACE
jgi:hypothetical protein